MLIPRDEIGYMSAILEGYPNGFLLRTEERGAGWIRVWYPATNRPLLDALLREFRTEFPIDGIEFQPGMAGLDEVYPDGG